ncbi:alpha/beta hydrolase [Actinosynnema sp. NPDC020468]|uniref:alpha/beta fold hydrolase n=1 Tax=Actinosynnema sp. NPDC020468 TaxID=3154488 RepID=UPI0033E7B8A2
MGQVRSQDGTTIGYTRRGSGPAVVLVDGAMCYRAFGPLEKLAQALEDRFTVYTYDRRGRGESGDTAPYAREREVEDLAALVEEAGGRAHLVGVSSGGTLVAEAVNLGVPAEKFVVYESPMVVDATHPPMPADLPATLRDLVDTDRRGDAVKLFMRWVGTPGFFVAILPLLPPWKKLKPVAHTLPYDVEFVREFQHGTPLPADRYAGAKAPGLVVAGAKSPEYMRNAQARLAEVLPNAELLVLPGQTHLVKADALAPAVTDFLTR